MNWYSWGTGHGKGLHDGIGVCLKQCLHKEQLKLHGVKILHNVHDVVPFLNSMPCAFYERTRQNIV
jgi:hypothetical protein